MKTRRLAHPIPLVLVAVLLCLGCDDPNQVLVPGSTVVKLGREDIAPIPLAASLIGDEAQTSPIIRDEKNPSPRHQDASPSRGILQ